MNFRKNVHPERIVFQIAPMVDILLFLLVFFIMTWNFARNEAELDVKVPSAREGKENRRPVGEVILNVRKDGQIIMNRKVDDSRGAQGCLTRVASFIPIRPSSSAATKASATGTSSESSTSAAPRISGTWPLPRIARNEDLATGKRGMPPRLPIGSR